MACMSEHDFNIFRMVTKRFPAARSENLERWASLNFIQAKHFNVTKMEPKNGCPDVLFESISLMAELCYPGKPIETADNSNINLNVEKDWALVDQNMRGQWNRF